MFVGDTSAYLNGWRDHYPPSTFPSVWELLAEAIADSRIISRGRCIGSSPARTTRLRCGRGTGRVPWSSRVRRFRARPARSSVCSRIRGLVMADPFVIAEAKVRGFTVVTYEGRSFSGIPHRRWDRTMPGICQRLSVSCRTLPEALTALGGAF